ncbi:MAG: hypothetical protein ACI4U0_00235 [Candidatus Aphodocola sp.]
MYLLVEVCQNQDVQKVMGIVRLLMNVICIIVPIVMIILGSFDLFKAVTAGKDEDIKKKQSVLIKRVIAGLIIFLVPTIVSILMNLIGVSEWRTCWNEAETSFQDLFNGEVSE